MSLEAALEAVRGSGTAAWLVGGAVRDRHLGRATHDLDVVVAENPRSLARDVARAAGAHAFELSGAFGGWRVTARDHLWQLDLLALDGEGLEADLARRDLTVNAIAEPLGGGCVVDPFGGLADLAARRLRMVSPAAFAHDPLRVMRLARLATELGFAMDPDTVARARESAPGLTRVAAERVLAELRGLLLSPAALDGLDHLAAVGATPVVLPELTALDGVGQSHYHHLDVAGHTRSVLAETIALVDEPGSLGLRGGDTEALAAALAAPLADGFTRGQALRLGALLHDIAKPQVRGVTATGRVTFMEHDTRGATMSRAILQRLRASERLATHVAALTRHHLRLGFLVHERPLDAYAVYGYLHGCDPVGVDVSVLSVADRLATRGRNADAAIAAHLALAREMIPAALAWEADPPRPPIRGDRLAQALEIAPGADLGVLLAQLRAAAYAGDVSDEATAVAWARERGRAMGDAASDLRGE